MRLTIKDYKHWRFKYELMRFGVLLLVVAIFWIGIELYTTYVSDEFDDDYSTQIEPLNPALDLDMMEELAGRADVEGEFVILLPESSPGTNVPRQRPPTLPSQLASPGATLQ